MSLHLLRGWIWASVRCLVCIFVGFWDRDYVSQPPCYQDLVSCYFCFVLLPLGPEKW